MGGKGELHKQDDRGGSLWAFEPGLLRPLPSYVLPPSVSKILLVPLSERPLGTQCDLRKGDRMEGALQSGLLPDHHPTPECF